MTEIFNFDANGELVEKFEHVLRQHNHELSAAEFHGTLTGLVCAGHSDRNIDQWQALLVADSEARPLLDAMRGLMALTERALESPAFSRFFVLALHCLNEPMRWVTGVEVLPWGLGGMIQPR